MRTNIDIDDALMAAALQAGPFKTKKEAVEAGLRLLGRQAAYREILKWRGKLKWEGDEAVDWTAQPEEAGAVMEPKIRYGAAPNRAVKRATTEIIKGNTKAATEGPRRARR